MALRIWPATRPFGVGAELGIEFRGQGGVDRIVTAISDSMFRPFLSWKVNSSLTPWAPSVALPE